MKSVSKAGIIGLILLLVAASIPMVAAQGYSIIENDIEMKFNYPPEIKLGTCFSLSFWMKAKKNLTDLDVRLTIFHHRDSYTGVIYDEVIVSEAEVTEGWTTSKTIDICVPRDGVPDPYLQADVQVSYTIDASDVHLEHEWYMSIVRDETYEELEEELSEANQRIDYLEDKINDLKDEVDELEEELEAKERELEELKEDYDQLLSEYNNLLNRYEELKKEYSDLSEEYSALEEEYDQLRDTHQSTLLDLERLRTKYELLSDDYSELDETYRSLLQDYENTLAELRTYKTMYDDLKRRHEDLQGRHNEAIAEIASLKQRVKDLEEDYGILSRMYRATLDESTMAKSIILAQAAAVLAGIGIYILVSRRMTRRPPEARPREGNTNEANSEKKVQKVLSGRRVTIPSAVAEKLGLKEGDKVEVEYGNGQIVIKPYKEPESEPSDSKNVIPTT